MSVFWPGFIIGLLLVAVCIVAYVKRDAVGRFANSRFRVFMPGDPPSDPEGTKTLLMLPIFGGMGLGLAIFIFSLTGVLK